MTRPAITIAQPDAHGIRLLWLGDACLGWAKRLDGHRRGPRGGHAIHYWRVHLEDAPEDEQYADTIDDVRRLVERDYARRMREDR